jgi:hypothetical protein
MARHSKKHKDDVERDEKRRTMDEPVEAFHGGYMSGHGLMGADMLMPPMYVGEDSESGNPVPLGANENNVRDDIPAMISEGEYVLPADVVKWYGLKGIIDFQNEARMGLMSMAAEDLIQHIDPEMDHDDEEEFEDEYETEEGNMVEFAEHLIEDGLDVSDEDDEEYPTEVGRGAFRVTPKIAFIR